MKSWYIISKEFEKQCEFVAVTASTKCLFLNYCGVTVKIRLHDFKNEYARAKSGIETVAFAVSSKGRNHGKPIKIVFK
ncbi:MAG TPA: hypothetical protein VGN20_06500 [Mucilaginibacter sp.]|jgi:hypothetical protein